MFKLLLFIGCLLSLTANPSEQAVVFDFGGVVAETKSSFLIDFFSRTLNLDRKEIRPVLVQMLDYVKKGGTERAFWELYGESRNVKIGPDWFNEYDSVIRSSVVPNLGTFEIIKELKKQGYQTALLSDINEYQARYLRNLGLYDPFDPVLLSYQTGFEKPTPEAFQNLIKELGKEPSHIVFIDDRVENVEGASKVGIDGIHFKNADDLKSELKTRGFDL